MITDVQNYMDECLTRTLLSNTTRHYDGDIFAFSLSFGVWAKIGVNFGLCMLSDGTCIKDDDIGFDRFVSFWV
jgi:hypothetical protein